MLGDLNPIHLVQEAQGEVEREALGIMSDELRAMLFQCFGEQTGDVIHIRHLADINRKVIKGHAVQHFQVHAPRLVIRPAIVAAHLVLLVSDNVGSHVMNVSGWAASVKPLHVRDNAGLRDVAVPIIIQIPDGNVVAIHLAVP